MEKNRGKHFVLCEGIKMAKGNQIVSIDCDLQYKPADIVRLKKQLDHSKHINAVFTRRTNRKDHLLRKACSVVFHWLLALKCHHRFDHNVGDYWIAESAVVTQLAQTIYAQTHLTLWILLNLLPSEIATIEIEHQERYAGKSAFRPLPLIRLAMKTLFLFRNPSAKNCA